MNIDQKNKTSKRPYETPKLRVIELVAEEVLATGCKHGNIGGPYGVNCVASQCAGSGS
jgi:hypothetical protein